jgi:hypothetical protein
MAFIERTAGSCFPSEAPPEPVKNNLLQKRVMGSIPTAPTNLLDSAEVAFLLSNKTLLSSNWTSSPAL